MLNLSGYPVRLEHILKTSTGDVNRILRKVSNFSLTTVLNVA